MCRGAEAPSNSAHTPLPDPPPLLQTRENGSLVSFETGQVTGYALEGVQQRGRLFIKPGEQVRWAFCSCSSFLPLACRLPASQPARRLRVASACLLLSRPLAALAAVEYRCPPNTLDLRLAQAVPELVGNLVVLVPVWACRG